MLNVLQLYGMLIYVANFVVAFVNCPAGDHFSMGKIKNTLFNFFTKRLTIQN